MLTTRPDWRALLISSYAPPMIGGPQNLYNLFSQFPAESYVVLTSAHAIDHRSGTTGTWLPGRYAYIDQEGPWEPGVAARFTDAARTPARERVATALEDIPWIGRFMFQSLALVRLAGAFLRRGRRLVGEIRPTVLVGISDIGPALWATYRLHRETGLPFVVYLFDLYDGNLLQRPHRWLARWLEPRLFARASSIVVTNEATEDLLRRRHGGQFRCTVIPNSVLPEDFERERQARPPSHPPRIVFTGNVYWPQEGAVLNLVRAMDLLSDLPVQLDLYVPKPSEALGRAVGQRENVSLQVAPQSAMPAIQCAASLLVLALSWNTRAPEIIATASPGKLTDYLAAGRPMLVHAPPYAHVTKLARERGFALVADVNEPAALASTIRRFLESPGTGDELVARADAVFADRFDARRNAEILREELRRVSCSSKLPGGTG